MKKKNTGTSDKYDYIGLLNMTLLPTHKQCNPMAIINESGQIITSPEGIKKLCLEEILQRVRHRKIHPELKELQQLKEILCEKRLNLVKHIKSDIWTN